MQSQATTVSTIQQFCICLAFTRLLGLAHAAFAALHILCVACMFHLLACLLACLCVCLHACLLASVATLAQAIWLKPLGSRFSWPTSHIPISAKMPAPWKNNRLPLAQRCPWPAPWELDGAKSSPPPLRRRSARRPRADATFDQVTRQGHDVQALRRERESRERAGATPSEPPLRRRRHVEATSCDVPREDSPARSSVRSASEDRHSPPSNASSPPLRRRRHTDAGSGEDYCEARRHADANVCNGTRDDSPARSNASVASGDRREPASDIGRQLEHSERLLREELIESGIGRKVGLAHSERLLRAALIKSDLGRRTQRSGESPHRSHDVGGSIGPVQPPEDGEYPGATAKAKPRPPPTNGLLVTRGSASKAARPGPKPRGSVALAMGLGQKRGDTSGHVAPVVSLRIIMTTKRDLRSRAASRIAQRAAAVQTRRAPCSPRGSAGRAPIGAFATRSLARASSQRLKRRKLDAGARGTAIAQRAVDAKIGVGRASIGAFATRSLARASSQRLKRRKLDASRNASALRKLDASRNAGARGTAREPPQRRKLHASRAGVPSGFGSGCEMASWPVRRHPATGSGPDRDSHAIVTVMKRPGEILGINVKDDGELMNVGAGLVADWNASAARRPVQAGDRIVEVNGQPFVTLPEIVHVFKEDGELTIVIERKQ